MKTRMEWLDIAKGIGILLVILSHCLCINEAPFQLIFTFHMQLFMILSGYLFTGRDPFPVLARKKAKSLLLPFCGYYLLGLAVTLLLPQWRQSLTWQDICKDLWLANPNAVRNSSIWFLAALYFVILLFHGIRKLPAWGQFMALLVSYSLGIWYSAQRVPFMGYNRLPLNLDVVPVALVFFALGFYASRSGIVQSLCKTWKRELAVAVLCTAGVWVVYLENGYVNMHGLRFGRSELYLLGGILGTLAVVSASAFLSRGEKGLALRMKQLLGWYGRHSLTILGLQSLMIRLYIEGMKYFFGREMTMYHFGRKDTLLCTALVGFLACPAGCLLLDRVKRYKFKVKEIA